MCSRECPLAGRRAADAPPAYVRPIFSYPRSHTFGYYPFAALHTRVRGAPEASREGRAVRGRTSFPTCSDSAPSRHSARPALRPVCGSLSALSLRGGAPRTGQVESWRNGVETAARGADEAPHKQTISRGASSAPRSLMGMHPGRKAAGPFSWDCRSASLTSSFLARGPALEDVADACLWIVTRPPHVTIRDLVSLPLNQDV